MAEKSLTRPAGTERHRALSDIGVAYDRSEQSDVALAHGARLAAAHHCRLRLRRVSNPTAGPSETAATITRGTQHIDGRELELVIGDLGQQLLAFSRQVDLLVWGSRRNRGLYRWVLGSTSDFLAHHAHVPLLIAPPAEGAVSPWRPRVHTAG